MAGSDAATPPTQSGADVRRRCESPSMPLAPLRPPPLGARMREVPTSHPSGARGGWMRTPSSDRDAAITSWPPTRSYCGQSTGADAQGGAASGLPAIHPAAASPSGRSSIRRSQLRACRALRHRVFDGKWTSYVFQRERSTSLVVAKEAQESGQTPDGAPVLGGWNGRRPAKPQTLPPFLVGGTAGVRPNPGQGGRTGAN